MNIVLFPLKLLIHALTALPPVRAVGRFVGAWWFVNDPDSVAYRRRFGWGLWRK